MFAMFCNLLHNPQVRHLIALGADLDLPTCDEIEAFLRDGLQETELLGAPLRRVVGTARVFPVAEGFDAERLRRALTFRALGKLSTPGLGETLLAALDELPRSPDAAPRVTVEIPVALPDDYATCRPRSAATRSSSAARWRRGTSWSRARCASAIR